MTIRAAATRRVLRLQGMPRQEIRAVLAAGDPLIVRRLMELHRERLGEWLEEQQRLVASIERSLAGERGEIPFGSVERPGHEHEGTHSFSLRASSPCR
jgi:hypothetical protein